MTEKAIFIKTKGGETLMGELINYDSDNLTLHATNLVKLITSFSTDPSTNISVPFNMPHLYCSFDDEESQVAMKFTDADIFGWNFLNDYYDRYYKSVYAELLRMEKAKQKYVAETMNRIAESYDTDGKTEEENDSFYIDPNDGIIDKIIH